MYAAKYGFTLEYVNVTDYVSSPALVLHILIFGMPILFEIFLNTFSSSAYAINSLDKFYLLLLKFVGGIAQSVLLLATSWTIKGSEFESR
jgi:hypothetical protein